MTLLLLRLAANVRYLGLIVWLTISLTLLLHVEGKSVLSWDFPKLSPEKGKNKSIIPGGNFLTRGRAISDLGRVVQSGVKLCQGWWEIFDFRYESLRSKFSFILSAYNLMIGGSKKKRENYPGKCFWTKETRVKI